MFQVQRTLKVLDTICLALDKIAVGFDLLLQTVDSPLQLSWLCGAEIFCTAKRAYSFQS